MPESRAALPTPCSSLLGSRWLAPAFHLAQPWGIPGWSWWPSPQEVAAAPPSRCSWPWQKQLPVLLPSQPHSSLPPKPATANHDRASYADKCHPSCLPL